MFWKAWSACSSPEGPRKKIPNKFHQDMSYLSASGPATNISTRLIRAATSGHPCGGGGAISPGLELKVARRDVEGAVDLYRLKIVCLVGEPLHPSSGLAPSFKPARPVVIGPAATAYQNGQFVARQSVQYQLFPQMYSRGQRPFLHIWISMASRVNGKALTGPKNHLSSIR